MKNKSKIFLELFILAVLVFIALFAASFLFVKKQSLSTTETYNESDGSRILREYKQGKLVSETQYDSDGTIYSTEEIEYDANGNQILLNVKFESEELNYGFKRKSEYDADNRLLTSSQYNLEGQLEQQTDYNYTGQGYVYTITEYDSKEQITNKIKHYSQNQSDTILETMAYNIDSSLSYHEKWHEVCSAVSEKTQYKTDSSIDWRLIHTYDSDCNKVRQSWYHSMTGLTKVTNYDAQGNYIDTTD